MSQCFANPNVYPLDHEVHLIECVQISVHVKSKLVLEKFSFSLKFQKKNVSMKQDFKAIYFLEDDHAKSILFHGGTPP
jgi:hypothetical protein